MAKNPDELAAEARAAEARVAEARAAEARAAEARAAEARVAEARAAEARAAEARVAAERTAAEAKAAEAKAAAERTAAQAKAAEAKAGAEREAAEQKVAELKAAEAKAGAERTAAEQKVTELRTAEAKAGAERTAAEQKVAELRATRSGTGPGGLEKAAQAVYELGWWPLVGRITSIVIIIVLMWFGSTLLGRGDINQGVSDVGFTRGLITLVLLLFIIAMAITLILYLINEEKDEKIKLRVDSARDILTPLLGIFGTVIGFYFGSFDKTPTTPADMATVQALGGVLVGDSAYFRDGTMPDADLVKLAAIHPLRRLYLDHTKVTDAGVAAHLVKLDDLT